MSWCHHCRKVWGTVGWLNAFILWDKCLWEPEGWHDRLNNSLSSHTHTYPQDVYILIFEGCECKKIVRDYAEATHTQIQNLWVGHNLLITAKSSSEHHWVTSVMLCPQMIQGSDVTPAYSRPYLENVPQFLKTWLGFSCYCCFVFVLRQDLKNVITHAGLKLWSS